MHSPKGELRSAPSFPKLWHAYTSGYTATANRCAQTNSF